MKLAVLLFGDYREFEKASISFNVFKDVDVDYYISTWDKTTYYDEEYNAQVKHINKELFNNFLNPTPVFISTLKEEDYNELDYTQKMIKHWKVLGEALSNSTKTYDSVLLLRIEFYVHNFNPQALFSEGNDNKLHIALGGLRKEGSEYTVADVCHSGSKKIILEYINLLPIYPALVSHIDFGRILHTSKLEVADQSSISGRILRPTTSRYLTNCHDTNIKLLNKNQKKLDLLFELYSVWHHTYSYDNPPKYTFREYLIRQGNNINSFDKLNTE